MWTIILRIVRNYAPVITLPFAAVVGLIGYNLENILSDKSTPSIESTKKKRDERLLTEFRDELTTLKQHAFVPDTIFERNVSPSLSELPKPEKKNLW